MAGSSSRTQSLLVLCSHGPDVPHVLCRRIVFGPCLHNFTKPVWQRRSKTRLFSFSRASALACAFLKTCWLEPLARLPPPSAQPGGFWGSLWAPLQAWCSTTRLVPSRSRLVPGSHAVQPAQARQPCGKRGAGCSRTCVPGAPSCRRVYAVLRPALALPCGRPDASQPVAAFRCRA